MSVSKFNNEGYYDPVVYEALTKVEAEERAARAAAAYRPLMNCGKDMSSTMYGMSRIGEDVFLFITYHKEEAEEGKNYADGKPDYADVFEDNLIFKWDSQIGKDNGSPYMQKVLTAPRKHLLVKKSDAESSFYYMGQFDIMESVDSQKEDNSGKMKPIAKVTIKMHHPVREDLLRYLQSNISKENKAV